MADAVERRAFTLAFNATEKQAEFVMAAAMNAMCLIDDGGGEGVSVNFDSPVEFAQDHVDTDEERVAFSNRMMQLEEAVLPDAPIVLDLKDYRRAG